MIDLPAGIERYPEPYCSLAAVRDFVTNPLRANPAMLRRLGEAMRGYLTGIDPIAVLDLPRTPGALRRLQRDCWLLAAHERIGGGPRTLQEAVAAFHEHPWSVWEKAKKCPAIHRDHAPGSYELFHAFRAGCHPMSEEFFRGLLESQVFPDKKLALEHAWQPRIINSR